MPEDPTRPSESTLNIALAEYAQLQEARRAVHTESNARFTFFLGVATASTAVSAGLVTTDRSTGGSARTTAVLALGAVVLLLGFAVFARQLEFNDRARRYAVASTTLRTYLVRQAPELAPYVMMPTLDDPGPFAAEPYRRGWSRDLIGLAGTVGLLNSALLAAASGLAVSRAASGWASLGLGATVFVCAVAAHLALFRRRLAASARQVGQVIDRRPALSADSRLATGAAGTATADPTTTGTTTVRPATNEPATVDTATTEATTVKPAAADSPPR